MCAAAVAFALVLAGCTIPTDSEVGTPEPSTTPPVPLVGTVDEGAPGGRAAAALTGKIVFLDPGHSGSNDAAMTAQVPTGRGGTKDCQTTGTSTDSGYPEHTFTWQVVGLMRVELEQLGARVQVSRTDDSSVGRCVDERAAVANSSGADAVVAVHADGAGTDQRGFHVSYSDPPLNDMQAESVTFARAMRDALVDEGLVTSTYTGENGLLPRADLAGLNLAERPSVLVELGNMRNPEEALRMADEVGRAHYAEAVVRGIARYLDGR